MVSLELRRGSGWGPPLLEVLLAEIEGLRLESQAEKRGSREKEGTYRDNRLKAHILVDSSIEQYNGFLGDRLEITAQVLTRT